IEQLVRGSLAELGRMLEHEQIARGHQSPGRGAIMVEHVDQCLPEDFKIFLVKSRLPRQIGVDETVGTIKAVRDRMLVAHFGRGPRLLFLLLVRRIGDARYAMLVVEHAMEGTREGDLDRTSDLSTSIFRCA